MSTIQKGDTVLVTGVTGFIGGHVALELVAAGYKVRGTSRSSEKAKTIIKLIEKRHGSGKIEITEVPDMVAPDAYDQAVKGIKGVVHLASVLTFSANPDEVIPPSVQGALNVFRSATREPSIKSFVFTSSSTAALTPVANTKISVTKDSWNDFAVEGARKPSPDPFTVYAASKTEAERAIWNAVKESKPSFQVSAVLPNANFGTRLRDEGNSTGDWPIAMYHGADFMFSYPPQYYINVQDDAKLHVAALTDPACNGQRIFAFAGAFNGNDILSIFRKLEPSKSFMEDREHGHDLSEVPNGEAEALLKKHYGHGWTSLEETLKQTIGPVAS